MLNLHTPPPKQVLLRLPEDVAAKLAHHVPPRQRNKFLVALVRQELEREDAQMVAACEAMNALEAAHPGLLTETQVWLDADLTGSVDKWDASFDRDSFEREFAIAQAAQATTKSALKPQK